MADALIIPVDSSQVEKGKRSLADLATQGKKTEQAIDGLGATGKKSASALSSIAGGAKVAALGLAGVGVSLTAIGAAVLNTSISFEKLNNTLKFSTGSAAGAAKELEYLKNTTNTLGLEFLSTAQAFAKFSAAAKGTTLEGQKTRDIFESIAKASTVLGLSADETSGALKAIEQIISKGTVSSEELRGQLGERLPGAFQIAARAIGVTTKELGKMLEQGQVVSDVFLPKFAAELTKTLGDSPQSAAGSAQAQLNKLSNAWLDFKKAIADTGVIRIVVVGAEAATATINGLAGLFAPRTSNKSDQQYKLKQLEKQQKDNQGLYGYLVPDSYKQSINSQVNQLKMQLGIFSKSSTQTPGRNDASISYSPNFAVATKEGQGGYDASVNNQKQIEDANKAAAMGFNDAKQKAEQLRKQRLEELQRQIDEEFEASDMINSYKLKNLDEYNKELLKEIQDSIDEEFDMQEAASKVKQELIEKEFKFRQDELEKIAKKEEELAKDINKSLTDALLRGFESGKGFAKNFRDTLVNLFKTLILRPIIEATLKPLTDGVSSILSKGLTGGATGGSGGGIFGNASNLFSIGKSIYSGFSSALSSNIGGLVANFAPQLGSSIAGTALGSFAGQGATIAGSATGLGSLTTGIGAFGKAISTALPYVGLALTAFSVFKSVFGGKKKIPRFSTLRAGDYADGVFTGRSNGQQYKPLGAEKQIDGLSEQFSKTLGGFLKGFGLSDSISTTASLFKKRKASYGNFSATFDGGNVSAGEQGKAKNVQQTFENLVETVLGTTIVQAIQQSKAAEGIKALFNGLTDKTQVVNMINASLTLQEAQKELADKYGLTTDLAGKVSVASGEAGDALAGFVNQLSAVALGSRSVGTQLIKNRDKLAADFNTVFGDVLTEAVLSTVSRQVPIAATASKSATLGLGGFGRLPQANGLAGILNQLKAPALQQFTTVTEQVTTFVDRIVSRNLQLPRTIADYDNLLKNIDKSAAAGQKMFAEVFALRDEFVAFTSAVDGLKGNVRGALFGLVSDVEKQGMLNEDLAKLFGSLNRAVPQSEQELIALGRSIDYGTQAGLDLAAVFPSLVSAFKEAQNGIESLAKSLRDESGFKTLYDFNFYKGIASNYGAEFANRLNDGAAVTYGASNNTSANLPLNIAPNNNTTISTSDPNMLNAITLLTNTVNTLKAEIISIKTNTKSSADTLLRVSPDGNSIQTKVAA